MQDWPQIIKRLKIAGIAQDSREVKKDYLFVAIKGLKVDSHKFIGEAISGGAIVIVGEVKPQAKWPGKVEYIQVESSRQALGEISSAWYGNPSKKLKIIGVTGTDGKTTTSSIISWILNSAGIKTGLISTVGAEIGDKQIQTGAHVTSPEPQDLHPLLKKMVEERCKVAVLEVSSHAIHQHRFAGVDFNIGVLTNITPEHLDYHKTFKDYANTKISFLNKSRTYYVNADHISTANLKKQFDLSKASPYGLNNLDKVIIKAIKYRFPGDYNRQNASASASIALVLGVNNHAIAKAIRNFPGVVGRMQKVENKKGLNIFIDYAHTPNGLQCALTAARSATQKKLIVITGAEGERDKTKRPQMGKIALEFADYTIFTTVDDRSEEVNAIISDMTTGLRADSFHKITDRAKATYTAINDIAHAGDTVLICGKGHENTININGTDHPWSDHDAVINALS
jgi:UDP-N-acetylmuramoyl-L-alanyl-D-glutamate--2,6-diaminopimelate ligase